VTFRDYSVFGLRVRSEIPLPELFEADSGEADVTIRLGPVGAPAETERGLHPVAGDLLFVEPEVGRYRIAGGSEIVVEANPGVPERNLRLFLLGSAFGALLHQRGLLPLHANAVEIAGKAVAFMGPSGAGKSTLAAWFHDHGYRIIADDVCVVGFDDYGQPYVAPGLPRLRLWAEALALMGRESSGLARSYVGTRQLDKFDVPIDPASAAKSDTALAGLYLLDRDVDFAVFQLGGVEAADAVFANTYRGSYVSATSGQKGHWQSAMRLVQSTPVFRVGREWDLAKLEEQYSRLLEHARGVSREMRDRERSTA
jgi:hypothetical protein